jgi:hypothetical protein
MASQNVVNPVELCSQFGSVEYLFQFNRMVWTGAHTSLGHFCGGTKGVRSEGAAAPLSLARSSSGDGNFAIAFFVPSRSMKVGHVLSDWKVLRRGVNAPGLIGEPT